MACRIGISVGAILLAGIALSSFARSAEPALEEPAAVRFESQIAPILQARCGKCHGEGKIEAGLDVRRKFTLVKGGDSGTALVEGKPDESLLVTRVEKGEMPPADEGTLDETQRKLLRRWVESGAPLVKSPETPLEETDLPSRFSDEDRAFWAFQPPRRPTLPAVRNPGRLRTPLDAFVAMQLETRQLEMNPDAAKHTLIRRFAFDLLGLPPTVDEVADFLADDGPDGVERLVDRYLASPRFGERWGRHWLDIAGYADSDGYLAADRVRPEAWRYRDYVIDAHNGDLPFDQFVREQLAGDELSDWRRAEELTADMVRQLTATGFLRTASDPTYPGYTEPNEIHQVMSDTMQIVGSAFLGLTIQCARCHSHKFDPLSQRDYFALQTVFLPALDPARWQPSEVRGIPMATEAQLTRINEINQKADARVAELNAKLNELSGRFRQMRVQELIQRLGEPIADSFDAAELSNGWSVALAGTAKNWSATPRDGSLEVRNIEGGTGYALVRLSRPVVLTGEFQSSLTFRWQSQDGEPMANKAMQGVILNLRDGAGNLVASSGYIDENNTARGSPISGISTAADPLGADVVAHHMKRYQQAVPPNDKARALAPGGTATVTIRRDAGGVVTTSFDDRRIQYAESSENRSVVTLVELEFRRYVLGAEATFDGLWADDFQIASGPTGNVPSSTLEALTAALRVAPEQRSAEQKKVVAEYAPNWSVADADLARVYPEYQKESAQIKAEVAAQQARKQNVVQIRGLMDLDGAIPEGHILRRGDYNRPGAAVGASVPEVLAPTGFTLTATAGYKTSGRRAALAQWLTDPNHPLLSRVQMNRVWARHFGRALVATQANFGRSGTRPTHPELLDWLATELPRRDWSMKQMHRLMTTSTTYRQSAALDAVKTERDPNNDWFGAWQPRRHEGEVLRDSALAVAGKLNTIQFGRPAPVHPQGDGSVITADDAQGNRRSIYVTVRRSQHLTMFDLFDTPLMEVNCPERGNSTVPLQALALLHGPMAERSAADLGERLWHSADSDSARIDAAFQLLFSRAPTDSQRKTIEQFLAAVARDQSGAPEAGATPAARDMASRAAWKQLALVLLNSNEFVYVD